MNAAAREQVRLARDARRRELVADDNIQDAQKVYGRHGGPKRIGGRVAAEDGRLAARDDERNSASRHLRH